MSSLSTYDLRKHYDKRFAVRDISVKVCSGEVVGILGPNGSGKTTLFRMLSGIILPDNGKIFLDDYDVTFFPIHVRANMGIGYLPQEMSIFRGLNVEQNILSVLELRERDPELRQHKLDSLLAEFSITHLRSADALSLSGGERRRLEIARCLAMSPKFILLDEPLAGIDPIAISDIKVMIKLLSEKHNIGILITDHNVREALEMITRAYIIHDGSVLIEGSNETIKNSKIVRQTYLGDSFI